MHEIGEEMATSPAAEPAYEMMVAVAAVAAAVGPHRIKMDNDPPRIKTVVVVAAVVAVPPSHIKMAAAAAVLVVVSKQQAAVPPCHIETTVAVAATVAMMVALVVMLKWRWQQWRLLLLSLLVVSTPARLGGMVIVLAPVPALCCGAMVAAALVLGASAVVVPLLLAELAFIISTQQRLVGERGATSKKKVVWGGGEPGGRVVGGRCWDEAVIAASSLQQQWSHPAVASSSPRLPAPLPSLALLRPPHIAAPGVMKGGGYVAAVVRYAQGSCGSWGCQTGGNHNGCGHVGVAAAKRQAAGEAGGGKLTVVGRCRCSNKLEHGLVNQRQTFEKETMTCTAYGLDVVVDAPAVSWGRRCNSGIMRWPSMHLGHRRFIIEGSGQAHTPPTTAYPHIPVCPSRGCLDAALMRPDDEPIATSTVGIEGTKKPRGDPGRGRPTRPYDEMKNVFFISSYNVIIAWVCQAMLVFILSTCNPTGISSSATAFYAQQFTQAMTPRCRGCNDNGATMAGAPTIMLQHRRQGSTQAIVQALGDASHIPIPASAYLAPAIQRAAHWGLRVLVGRWDGGVMGPTRLYKETATCIVVLGACAAILEWACLGGVDVAYANEHGIDDTTTMMRTQDFAAGAIMITPRCHGGNDNDAAMMGVGAGKHDGWTVARWWNRAVPAMQALQGDSEQPNLGKFNLPKSTWDQKPEEMKSPRVLWGTVTMSKDIQRHPEQPKAAQAAFRFPDEERTKAMKPLSDRLWSGRGALARHGDYWYPVRLIMRENDGWIVRWWRHNLFLDNTISPDEISLVAFPDLVDSLWGDTEGRRRIRLGQWKHAHEVETSEDILSDPSSIPYSNRTFNRNSHYPSSRARGGYFYPLAMDELVLIKGWASLREING
ncbi:hypothetical protein BDZ97DRAFT_2061240 [Flammula alnicola]|nr:hypothetical protein BDZ97DRAFT_2061240 [Flammula alnicola]